MIPSKPVFALSAKCCVLSGEVTTTNFIVFGVTRSSLEPTKYRTRGELDDITQQLVVTVPDDVFSQKCVVRTKFDI